MWTSAHSLGWTKYFPTYQEETTSQNLILRMHINMEIEEGRQKLLIINTS